MAKRINLGIPNVRVNETSYAVLRVIAEAAAAKTGLRCGCVSVSHRQIRRHVPMSEQTIMRSCASLCENGLMLQSSSALETGAQAANTYQITALGLEVLRQADELLR